MATNNLARNLDLINKAGRVVPEIGMGATISVGSDCYPYTVVAIAPDYSWIDVTKDSTTPAPEFDFYGNQNYMYASNLNGQRIRHKLSTRGKRAGRYNTIYVGNRRFYQDPCF